MIPRRLLQREAPCGSFIRLACKSVLRINPSESVQARVYFLKSRKCRLRGEFSRLAFRVSRKKKKKIKEERERATEKKKEEEEGTIPETWDRPRTLENSTAASSDARINSHLICYGRRSRRRRTVILPASSFFVIAQCILRGARARATHVYSHAVIVRAAPRLQYVHVGDESSGIKGEKERERETV